MTVTTSAKPAKSQKPAPRGGAWFHPHNLLDRAYEIGIIIKGVDGALEIIGGLLLVCVPARTIEHVVWLMTHNELASDPSDFLANHAVRIGHQLSTGRLTFALAFLLPHGAVKVGLVVALLRQKHWAYPWALGALILFLVYQIYLLATQPTFTMAFFTVLDVVIIWLVWCEWQQVKRQPKPATSDTAP